jgi:hypothetical protein
MKIQPPLSPLLFFGALLCILFPSCHNPATNEKELEDLKNGLFRRATDVSELPIYADPPTADYEDVRKGIFAFQIDSAKREMIKKYRDELEPLIVQRIDSGYAWVYLAAYLRYQSAIPKLKNELLKCNHFYGWEGGDYQKIERYLDDEQYCYQMAYISAIEYISGKPVSKAITLTYEENAALKTKADKCFECNKDALAFCYARWLLNKLNRNRKVVL